MRSALMHLDLHFQFKLSCFENDCAKPYFFFKIFSEDILGNQGKKNGAYISVAF